MLEDKVKIKKWLEEFEISQYTINDNLTVDVNDHVDISYCHLKKIPIQFGVINGSFNCSHNKLTTLKGAPFIVRGLFNCSFNLLKDLSYSPKEAQNLICSNNKLTTLKGAPQDLVNMYCEKNRLTNLEGAPAKIHNTLDVSDNEITSLTGVSKEIGHCLSINKNTLSTLVELSNCMLEASLMANNNQLTNLSGLPHHLIQVDVRDNPLSDQSELIYLTKLEELLVSNFLNLQETLELTSCTIETEIKDYQDLIKIYNEKQNLNKAINSKIKAKNKVKI